jgi:hypothetical protein
MVWKRVRIVLVAVLGCLVASTGHAHISLDQAGTHKSRYGDSDDDIKNGPCGRAGGTRGTNVYTYKAGEMIEVEVSEFVSHPGYFRIAFDNDGDDGFKAPASIPSEPPSGRACMGAGDKCGQADYYNNETVLEGMDNLDPHLDGEDDTKWKWKVQLPDVTCDNCTLQIIQIMTESFRAPYDPDATTGVGDVYYQCIDLVLTPKEATGAAGASAAAGAGGSGAPNPGSAGQSASGMPAGTAGIGGVAMSAAVGAPASAGTGGSGTPPPSAIPASRQPAPTAAASAPPAPAPAPAASSESSGCSVGAWPVDGSFAGCLLPAWLALWRRRRSAARVSV